jgi:CHAT domain-containing protein
LNAGDIAANTKSAMIYTFLSGTTQDNPSGTSLNLFAVTSASDIIYRTIPLINKDLGSIVADFRAGVQGLDYDYESSGSNLYDLIIRPLKATLDLSQVNNLVFSTDNLFRTIPLAALYDKQTSNFLVEDFSSSIAPSFQVIEKDKYTSLKSANVLKMGATVFGSQRPLPSVRTELENIAQIELQNSPNIRHSPIYLNDQFSDGILKKSIAKNDAPIIHLATHGDISNSGGFVFLGSNNSSGQSDRLNASDIRQLRDLSNKDLLVFSTCLSFTGFNYSTAGAALVAGVKSVIGCRWIVSDSATMVAMTGFYQELLSNGLSKTKALQEAQKSMLLGNVKVTDVAGTTDRAELSIKEAKVISSEYGQKDIKAKVYSAVDPNLNYLKHPFYWAAFSLIGNPW